LPCAIKGVAQRAAADPIAVAPNCRLLRTICSSRFLNYW
jgi:hypothetical protein